VDPTTHATLVPCHTCDFVARQSRATKSRNKIARVTWHLGFQGSNGGVPP